MADGAARPAICHRQQAGSRQQHRNREALSDIPTVGEFLPGYEGSNWYGLDVPKATPAEIVDQLNKEVNAALDDPR